MGKKVIIVGGGIAGLSAGVYALLAGLEAEIYEKNPVAGGQCTGWDRGGLHIDNCIHWLTGTREDTELYRVWRTLGALDEDTQYARRDAFFTSIYAGRRATLWHDLDRTRRELLALSPEDAPEIEKFITHVRYAQDCLFPAEKPMDMMGPLDYIRLGKAMGNMPKVMREYGNISLETLAGRFKHPALRQLMGDYMPKEYTAYSLLVSYATMACGNGKVPLGGSRALALRVRERFLALGGQIRENAPVETIDLEKGKAVGVTLAGGEKRRGDYVIPAVDADVLFGRLLPETYTPKALARAYADRASYPVTSGFQLAYALRGDFGYSGICLFPCRPFSIGSRQFDKLAFQVYDHDTIYTAAGRTVLQVNVCQGHEDYDDWSSLDPQAYRAAKAAAAETVTGRLVEEFPELEGRLELLDCWTPRTYARWCGAYHGAYMGFVTVPGVKPLRLKGTVRGIKNLYLAGQWVMAPGGLPVAATSGKFAVQRLLRREHSKGVVL